MIRFFYKGPADDKERYYRIVGSIRRSAMPNAITPTAARWPLLPPASAPSVVAPRQVNYRFQYANGSLTNTGNATLRILAYGPCLKAADGKECKENYYLMPGKSRVLRAWTRRIKGRVALWQGEQFVPVK